MKKKLPHRASTTNPPGLGARMLAEWVGGVRDLPDVAAFGGRMSLVVWVAGEQTLAADPVPRGSAKQVLATSVKALASRGGRPATVRVGSQDEAARVRAVLGRDVAVRVGATPEVDAAFDDLMDKLGMVATLDAMEKGEVTMHPLEELLALASRAPEVVARYVARAEALRRMAPWTLVPGDDMALVVDAPSRPWKQVTVKVLGQHAEVFGCAICRTPEDCLTLESGSPEAPTGRDMEILDFSAVDGIPASVRRAVDAQRWPLGRDARYPLLMGLSRAREPRPIELADVERATVVVTALAAFFAEHVAGLREDQYGERQSATLVDGEGVVVRYVDLRDLVDPVDEDDEAPLMLRVAPAKVASLAPEIDALFRRWTKDFIARHPAELKAAVSELTFARRGVREVRPDLRDEVVTTSLPLLWSAFYRPRGGAQDGLSTLLDARGYDDAEGARVAFTEARVLYGEYLGEAMPGVSRLRDLGDDRVYEVLGIDESQRSMYARWMRLLAVVVPVGDGRWYPPSLVLASEAAAELSFEGLVERTRAALEGLRRPLGALEGEALRAALRRELGVVFGALYRYLDEVAARPPKKRFLANSDGDRAEFVDCLVTLRGAVKQVAARLDAAPEWTRTTDQCWELIDRARTAANPEGEFMGQVVRSGRQWRVRANSSARVGRLFDRLEALLGERPVERAREVTEPWRDTPGLTGVREEADEVVQIVTGPATESAHGDPALMVLEAQHRMLDQRVEMIDGVPRALAATPEGRARVERWLRELERRGLPPGAGPRMLDLDPLRRELGMPTIG